MDVFTFEFKSIPPGGQLTNAKNRRNRPGDDQLGHRRHEGGEPVVIPNSEGSRTTPSVVAFTKSGERLVGTLARRQAAVNPENTVYSIKRFMGRKFGEVDSERKIVPYEVKPGKDDRAVVFVPNANKEFTPEEISALILQKLKADAEAYLGEKVTDAVITVPAYFNDS